jgi:hypothetical protein
MLIQYFVTLLKHFDYANHNTILSKLSFYGIKSKGGQWFKSYRQKIEE